MELSRNDLYLPESKIVVVSKVDDTIFKLKTVANLSFSAVEDFEEVTTWSSYEPFIYNNGLRIRLEWTHDRQRPLYTVRTPK